MRRSSSPVCEFFRVVLIDNQEAATWVDFDLGPPEGGRIVDRGPIFEEWQACRRQNPTS
jgi:hypothetical protein